MGTEHACHEVSSYKSYKNPELIGTRWNTWEKGKWAHQHYANIKTCHTLNMTMAMQMMASLAVPRLTRQHCMLKNAAAKHIRAIVAREGNQRKVGMFSSENTSDYPSYCQRGFSFFLTSSYIDKCFLCLQRTPPHLSETGQTRVNHHQETELLTASQWKAACKQLSLTPNGGAAIFGHD